MRLAPRAWQALAAYAVIAVAATWPLARGIGRDVAWDLGDPVLNMWILAWDCEQLLAILRGDLSRAAAFFDANIFHPAPLTLAYSEHLIAQAVQVLPVYAVSGNPILAYNLLYLSTFVLSGLGMFLFVRELTGRPIAAFVAGLLFAFAPYRMPQSPHVQVLSSQWMPFALFAFRRFFAAVEQGRGGGWPLAGAALALIAQNLSNGYFLLYFSPFAAAYVLWEIARGHFWRRRGMWARLGVAAAAVLAATIPFLLPYAAVSEGFEFARARSEVIRYSADVYSYATSSEGQLWGSAIRAYPKPEGDLFFGFATLILALAGVLAWRPPPSNGSFAPRWRHRLAWFLAAGVVIHLAATAAGLVYRRIVIDLWVFDLRITNITQVLVRTIVLGALLLAISPRARQRAAAFMSERGFFLAALLAAMWLSLGPAPEVLGRSIELWSPYEVLYENVPGYDGVRVPARMAMVAVLMIAVLGGYGAAAIERWRGGTAVVAALAIAALAEAVVTPFTVNGVTPVPGYNAPEARVYRPARAPNVYKAFAQEPAGAVLAELPLGEPDFDLRAIYYSIVHWRPVVNGYSGFYPPHYGRLALAVSDVPRFPDAAVEALRGVATTHVIVHESAFLEGRGAATTAALIGAGARELYRENGDVLLQLP